MPATPAPPQNDSLETAVSTSADALATMESDAAEFFAAKAAGEAAPLNPVAPALEAAKAAPAKPAPAAAKPAPAAKPAAAKPDTAVVKGAPSIKALEAAKPAPSDDAPLDPSLKDPNPPEDYSDIPRKFTGGLKSQNWEKLNRRADHYESLSVQRHQEIENLRAEVETAKAAALAAASPETAARLTSLQSERDALQARLEAVAVERSPRFEAQFKPRRDAALSQAKNAVGPADAAKVEQLLAMGESSYRDEQLEALLSTLPPIRATKLTQAVADLDRLATERASLASQGSELYKQWASEEQSARERQAAERTARATSTFDAEVKDWESSGLTPQEVETARSVYTGKNATLQDASRAALWGAIGPRVVVALQATQAKVAELEGELAKLRGVQPGVGASASGALPAANGADDDDPALTRYSDRIAKEALRQGLRFG